MTYQSEPDTIYLDSAVRASTVIGNLNDNNLVLDFTLSNFILATEYLVIGIPYQQLLYDSSSLQCYIMLSTDS